MADGKKQPPKGHGETSERKQDEQMTAQAIKESTARPTSVVSASASSQSQNGHGTDKAADDAAKAQRAQLDPQNLMAGKTVAAIMGEIVWLMTQSPRHKTMPLSDLEWMVMPPVLLKQFRIFYQEDRPVGVALYAMVSDLVAQRLDSNEKRLAPAEWRSGPHKRIVDIIAPFGGEEEMRGQM